MVSRFQWISVDSAKQQSQFFSGHSSQQGESAFDVFVFIKVALLKLYSSFVGFHCQLLTRGKTRAGFEMGESQWLRPELACLPVGLLHHLCLD